MPNGWEIDCYTPENPFKWGTIFGNGEQLLAAKTGSPRPILAAKFGPGRPVLAKFLPKSVQGTIFGGLISEGGQTELIIIFMKIN